MRIQAVLIVCFLWAISEASPSFLHDIIKKREADNDWRINGGEEADLNEFPYQVALTDKYGRLYCGGSLINERYVLTAGHCVHGKRPEQILVRLGEHDRSTTDESKHLEVEADKFIPHPKFNMVAVVNDLGLIRLSKPVEFSSIIRPVCLLTTEFNGPTAIVSGWGASNVLGDVVDKLQKLELQILSYSDCDAKLQGFRIYLSPEKICGYQPYKDSCKGDSGGPLATVDKGEKRSLVGVVSMGFKCGQSNKPGLYTRVSRYIDWIKQETKDATKTCYV